MTGGSLILRCAVPENLSFMKLQYCINQGFEVDGGSCDVEGLGWWCSQTICEHDGAYCICVMLFLSYILIFVAFNRSFAMQISLEGNSVMVLLGKTLVEASVAATIEQPASER